MADLEDVADDVPARESGKVPVGGVSAYSMETVVPTNFSGAGGLPLDDRILVTAAGAVVDMSPANLRALVELFACDVTTTPASGQIIGVDGAGKLTPLEALLFALTVNKYNQGRAWRSNGVAMVDELTGFVLPTTGAPASGTGYNGDLALDQATGAIYYKASGSWSAIPGGAGGTTAHALAARPVATALTNGVGTVVGWNNGNVSESGSAWTYNGDNSWSPPADGHYLVEFCPYVVKSTIGRKDFLSLGYWDLTGGGTYALWPGAYSGTGITGDDSSVTPDTNMSEVAGPISGVLPSCTTATKIQLQVFAKSTGQSVLNDAGHFRAWRIG